jgi:hypothetical protein
MLAVVEGGCRGFLLTSERIVYKRNGGETAGGYKIKREYAEGRTLEAASSGVCSEAM